MKRAIIYIALGALVVFASLAAKTWNPSLPPGNYINFQQGNVFTRLTMEGSIIEEVNQIKMNLSGASPDEHIAVNKNNLMFSWALKTDQNTDIWDANPITGWRHKVTTQTPQTSEMDPALDTWGSHLAFTKYEEGNIPDVISWNLSGFEGFQIEQKNAYAPAYGDTGLSYTLLDSGRIYPWGAPGIWHQYLPGGRGILYQDTRTSFKIWPASGVPLTFGNYQSVAISPDGTLAAVVTLDDNLEIQPLDSNFVPTGTAIPIPGFSNLKYVTWIEVK